MAERILHSTSTGRSATSITALRHPLARGHLPEPSILFAGAKVWRIFCHPLLGAPSHLPQLVTLTDSRGKHSVEVTAESLYEAAVLGVQILRTDQWFQEGVGAATKIEITVREPATIHTVTLAQIERWLSGATISPNERVRKDRLKGC